MKIDYGGSKLVRNRENSVFWRFSGARYFSLLRYSNLQLGAHLVEQGAPVLKKASLWREKKLRFGPKTVKEMGFLVYSGLH